MESGENKVEPVATRIAAFVPARTDSLRTLSLHLELDHHRRVSLGDQNRAARHQGRISSYRRAAITPTSCLVSSSLRPFPQAQTRRQQPVAFEILRWK